ncbi:M17 family metallopeptidase [[Acholeplasma] multilocale]|uniref:M17 family metallopeptidase n=1 Tax=[Acholeplasma] multilocale TaxID=264638 RepID=UPI00047D2568|nr:M17 family metallopeptidase [[Acholeplasma] multilocale]
MITLKGKKQDLTLVAITGEKAPKFVLTGEGDTTLLVDDKIINIVLKKGNADKRTQIVKALTKFVSTNKYNVNVDLDSFIKLVGKDKNFTPEQIFNTVYETISFVSHDKVSFKKTNKLNETIYNIVTEEDFKSIHEAAVIKTEFVNYARDLQDTPPNIGTSVYIAEKLAKDAKEIKGLKVSVLTKKEVEKLGMGLFLSVNAGSSVEPRVVVAEYVTDESLPRTALVGKGITFDSGGYNLKPSQFMEGMKFDMSGAAIMVSTVMALAKAGAKANIVAVGMFTDNRIGATATLPESVITSMNGITVEIGNTDAEGRLVLADGITYAIREKGADRIIEASTLTGAITIALGSTATGAFTHNDTLWNEFSKVSEFTGEKMWRMPIFPEHLEKVQADSALADLTNSAKGRECGSSTAAAFLNEFAEGKPYLHLDIAGTADNGTRGTGVLVKTLFEMLTK